MLYRRAFFELQSERPPAMGGHCPIPWSAIHAWASRYGIDDPDDFRDLYTMIRVQDDQWLSFAREQNPRKAQDSDEQVNF